MASDTRLAWGQLPSSKTALYTVPGNQRALIFTLVLINTDAAARTVNIYVGNGVNSRRICPKNLSIDPGAMVVLDDEIVIHEGERVEADASVAAVVDYVLSGRV